MGIRGNGLLKQKPLAVRKKKIQQLRSKSQQQKSKLAKNGRAIKLNSKFNKSGTRHNTLYSKWEGVGRSVQTIENSEKVVNRIRREKKLPKRIEYRKEKKEMMKKVLEKKQQEREYLSKITEGESDVSKKVNSDSTNKASESDDIDDEMIDAKSGKTLFAKPFSFTSAAEENVEKIIAERKKQKKVKTSNGSSGNTVTGNSGMDVEVTKKKVKKTGAKLRQLKKAKQAAGSGAAKMEM